MPAAYQDENGKWFKQCSKTGTLFGPVDTKEQLGQWYYKDNKKDGFRSDCKEAEKEKELEKQRLYYQKNSDKVKARHKRYRSTPSGFLTAYKKSAKKREINFTLTREWFEEQMTKPEFNTCYYSGVEFVNEHNHPFSRSLDRISSTKGYTPDNVKWVCFALNSWKGNITLFQMASILNTMAKHDNEDPFEVLKKVVDTQNI